MRFWVISHFAWLRIGIHFDYPFVYGYQIYAAGLCRARNSAARARPQRRQRQRRLALSTFRLSGVSEWPLPQISGMRMGSRIGSREKHTTSVLVASNRAPATICNGLHCRAPDCRFGPPFSQPALYCQGSQLPIVACRAVVPLPCCSAGHGKLGAWAVLEAQRDSNGTNQRTISRQMSAIEAAQVATRWPTHYAALSAREPLHR